MKLRNQLRNSIFISLALHVTIFAFPSANLQLLLPLKKSKLIEVSLVKMTAFPLTRERRAEEEPLSEAVDLSEERPQAQLPAPRKVAFEGTEVIKEQTLPIPEPTDISPERTVDFQGYPREAVTAIFERYGLKYERYNSKLGRTRTTSLVGTFTFEGKQLGDSWEDSPVSFAGEPRPGSMVLVIPARVYLDLLEAERKELRKRGLPLTTPLKKVVFGIGRDEQGHYALAVRELMLEEAAVSALADDL